MTSKGDTTAVNKTFDYLLAKILPQYLLCCVTPFKDSRTGNEGRSYNGSKLCEGHRGEQNRKEEGKRALNDGKPGLSDVETMQARTRYNRLAAVRYALRHWNNPNPAFGNFDNVGTGGDCANFVSQCMRAGGWPLDYRETALNTEWWYRRVGADRFDTSGNDWWSCTWSLAHSHFLYMRANHGLGINLMRNPRLARTLSRGDTIYYDWEGDGVLNHSSIVTGFSRSGQPLVTYRTLRPHRPVRNALWTLRFRGRAGAIVAVRLTDRPVVYPAAPNFNRLLPCDRTRL